MTYEQKLKILNVAKEIEAHPQLAQMLSDWKIIEEAMGKTSEEPTMTPEELAEIKAGIIAEALAYSPDTDVSSIEVSMPVNKLLITNEMKYNMNRVRFPELMTLIDGYWNLISQIPLDDDFEGEKAKEAKITIKNKDYDGYLKLDGNYFSVASMIHGMNLGLRIPTSDSDDVDGYYDQFFDKFIETISNI